MNPAISEYMRALQARSAAKRWSGLSAAERSAAMKTLRAKGRRKPSIVSKGDIADSTSPDAKKPRHD
jgi:hypothetical protein